MEHLLRTIEKNFNEAVCPFCGKRASLKLDYDERGTLVYSGVCCERRESLLASQISDLMKRNALSLLDFPNRM